MVHNFSHHQPFEITRQVTSVMHVMVTGRTVVSILNLPLQWLIWAPSGGLCVLKQDLYMFTHQSSAVEGYFCFSARWMNGIPVYQVP